MNRVREAGHRAYGCYAWIIFGLVLAFFGILIVLLHRPAYGRPVARFAAQILFRLTGMRISAKGLDHLPSEPHILVANHTSFLDAIAMAALLPARPGYAFVARQQYASQALLYPLLSALGTVILKRKTSSSRHLNIERMAAALRCGDNLVVFPEGRFTRTAGLRPFHSGAFVVAAKENVPIVAAGLRGARQALRLGTWLPRRQAIVLAIGPVFRPNSKDPQSLLQMRQSVRAAMQPLTGEQETINGTESVVPSSRK